MKNKSIFLFVLVLIGTISVLKSQTLHFSQYYSAPLFLGPSFAGYTEGSRIVANYRDQWPTMSGTFTTYSLSFDHHLFKKKSGIGFIATRDVAGTGKLGMTQGALQYSYNIKITKDLFVRPGIEAKYVQRNLDINELRFGDQIDANFVDEDKITSIDAVNFAEEDVKYINFSTSVAVVHKDFWIGATAKNLMNANQSFTGNESGTPLMAYFYGGYHIYYERSSHNYRKKSGSITPTFFYRYSNGYNQLDFGAYWRKAGISLGMWFRGMPAKAMAASNVDAIIFMVGYDFDVLSFGYTYDFTISDLLSATGGASELSLRFNLKSFSSSQGKRRRAMIPCPVF